MFTVQNNEVFPYPVGVNFVVTPYKPVFTISHNTVQAIIARNDNQKIAAISELRKLCSDQGLSLLDAKQIVEAVQKATRETAKCELCRDCRVLRPEPSMLVWNGELYAKQEDFPEEAKHEGVYTGWMPMICQDCMNGLYVRRGWNFRTVTLEEFTALDSNPQLY